MHPETMKFIQQFEQQAVRNGQYRAVLGKFEQAFLDLVWGPAMQYQFEGLQAEYPLKDFKGGQRFVDFVYTKGGIRLVIEIDGYTTHARDITQGDFSDHLMRQNDLILQGWMVLRFSTWQVEKRSMICQRQITQAIGHWWTLTHNQRSADELDIWRLRKQRIIQLALDHRGLIRSIDIARHFDVPPRTARDWTSRFVTEGILEPVCPRKNIIGYKLKDYEI